MKSERNVEPGGVVAFFGMRGEGAGVAAVWQARMYCSYHWALLLALTVANWVLCLRASLRTVSVLGRDLSCTHAVSRSFGPLDRARRMRSFRGQNKEESVTH